MVRSEFSLKFLDSEFSAFAGEHERKEAGDRLFKIGAAFPGIEGMEIRSKNRCVSSAGRIKMKAEKFIAETRAVFDPIADRYGMVFHESYAGSVAYGNNAVRLSIGYDFSRSCELSVSIGKISDDHSAAQSYDLAEILGMKGIAEAGEVSRLQISNENDLAHFLRMLGGLLVRHAAEFLEGRADAFMRLAQYCGGRDHRYNLDRQLLYVRADAEKAWLSRDYDGVIRALESMRPRLTPAELLRLDYAKKRKGSSEDKRRD